MAAEGRYWVFARETKSGLHEPPGERLPVDSSHDPAGSPRYGRARRGSEPAGRRRSRGPHAPGPWRLGV